MVELWRPIIFTGYLSLMWKFVLVVYVYRFIKVTIYNKDFVNTLGLNKFNIQVVLTTTQKTVVVSDISLPIFYIIRHEGRKQKVTFDERNDKCIVTLEESDLVRLSYRPKTCQVLTLWPLVKRSIKKK